MRRAIPLLCLFAAACGRLSVRPAYALFGVGGGIKEGDPAPMFSGLTIDNQRIDFAQLKGKKVVVLDFWSIYCASCIEEMPRLVEIHNEFSNKGLVVIGVNLDSFGTHRVVKFMQGMENKITFPVIIDKTRQIATSFNAMVLPTTLLIDASGKIRFYHVGYKPGDEKKLRSVVGTGRKGDPKVNLRPRENTRSLAVLLSVRRRVFVPGASFAQESKARSFTKIPTVKGIETIKAGSKAPDFKVQDLAGKEFHLARLPGQGRGPALLLVLLLRPLPRGDADDQPDGAGLPGEGPAGRRGQPRRAGDEEGDRQVRGEREDRLPDRLRRIGGRRLPRGRPVRRRRGPRPCSSSTSRGSSRSASWER